MSNSSVDYLMLIQSLLLVAYKPLTIKEIAKLIQLDKKQTEEYLEQLAERFNTTESGWWIVRTGDKIQLATNPAAASLLKEFLKSEELGELTRPSLEALTIIAYQGPISKIDLDRIRGVNCALILRNLMMKGLVEEVEVEGEKLYQVTIDFVKFLGISNVKELPDYQELHHHSTIEQMLEVEKEGEDK